MILSPSLIQGKECVDPTQILGKMWYVMWKQRPLANLMVLIMDCYLICAQSYGFLIQWQVTEASLLSCVL